MRSYGYAGRCRGYGKQQKNIGLYVTSIKSLTCILSLCWDVPIAMSSKRVSSKVQEGKSGPAKYFHPCPENVGNGCVDIKRTCLRLDNQVITFL